MLAVECVLQGSNVKKPDLRISQQKQRKVIEIELKPSIITQPHSTTSAVRVLAWLVVSGKGALLSESIWEMKGLSIIRSYFCVVE